MLVEEHGARSVDGGADFFAGEFSSTPDAPSGLLSKAARVSPGAPVGHTMARPTNSDRGGNGFGPCLGVVRGPAPSCIGQGEPGAVPAGGGVLHGDPPAGWNSQRTSGITSFGSAFTHWK